MATVRSDLNELQFFVQVAESRSFTLAARRLGMPKSSLSRAIHRLESRLGVRLIERTTRSVALTEAGEIYRNSCQRVLEEAEQADLAIGSLLAKPRGRLRIGASAMFIRAILGPALGEFLAEYPELRLHLQLLDADIPSREKDLDLMIRPGPLEDSGLLMKPLLRIRLGVYASPRYLEGRAAPAAPADLRELDCIAKGCGTAGEAKGSSLWRLRRGAESREVRIEARVSVPDPTMSHQLAVAGAGVAVISQAAARADIEAGRLVRVLPEWEPDPVELHALYPSRLDSSPKVRAFVEFLRERFSRGPLLETFGGKRAAG